MSSLPKWSQVVWFLYRTWVSVWRPKYNDKHQFMGINGMGSKGWNITVGLDQPMVVYTSESVSDEKIHQIVSEKRRWVFKKKEQQPQRYENLPHPPGKELVNRESALYLGRHYRIEMVKSVCWRTWSKLIVISASGTLSAIAHRQWKRPETD